MQTNFVPILVLAFVLGLAGCAQTTSDTESRNTSVNSTKTGTPPGANGETAPNSAASQSKAP